MNDRRDRAIPRTLDEVVDAERTALVVYDMQAGILSQLAGADEVAARVHRVLDAARHAGMRVVFTRHMGVPKPLMGTFQRRMALAWQHKDRVDDIAPMFLRGSPGFELAAGFEPLDSEAVFDKLAMSAFEGTPIDVVLRDCGVDSFAIVGVALEIGIEPTVRHGADRGFIPVVVADACGAGDRAAADRSLGALRFAGDAVIADSDAFVAALGTP